MLLQPVNFFYGLLPDKEKTVIKVATKPFSFIVLIIHLYLLKGLQCTCTSYTDLCILLFRSIIG